MLGMNCSISWYCNTKQSYDDCDSTYQRGDLHEYLKRKGALKRATCLRFAMDIARGMNYLHENKPEAIIHCNLEPYRNILRDDSGHLNVADFGVSKLLKVENRVKEDRPITCHDTSCRYVAPEVFRNEEYDTQVDVFSFALILQENGAFYNPNTVKDHSNYVVNSYYQRKGTVQGSCDFQNIASVTQTPPTVPTGCVYQSSPTGRGSTTPNTLMPAAAPRSLASPDDISLAPVGSGIGGTNSSIHGVVSLYDEVSLQNVSDVTADWTMKQRQMLRNKLRLGGFSRYLGEANSYVAELWAVWEGLKMARGLGFSKIELQVDSKAVMASISNHMADSFDDRGLFLRLSYFNGL
ncbi:hypothetical protein OROHE_013034 [Orobanche hederae]